MGDAYILPVGSHEKPDELFPDSYDIFKVVSNDHAVKFWIECLVPLRWAKCNPAIVVLSPTTATSLIIRHQPFNCQII